MVKLCLWKWKLFGETQRGSKFRSSWFFEEMEMEVIITMTDSTCMVSIIFLFPVLGRGVICLSSSHFLFNCTNAAEGF